jgi:hypothetical protein
MLLVLEKNRGRVNDILIGIVSIPVVFFAISFSNTIYDYLRIKIVCGIYRLFCPDLESFPYEVDLMGFKDFFILNSIWLFNSIIKFWIPLLAVLWLGNYLVKFFSRKQKEES